jgi:DNA gyrase subunit A
MDKLLPKLYKEYGQYSNWRSFPSELDGLKPVERRILFSAYQIAKKLTKSARVDGHVIGNYHPHGSVYGSIVQLVRQGFLDGQGNFGSNVGVEPVGAAASRYTEVALSEITNTLAFQNIKYVDWMVNDLDQNEPVHLPVMFPLCLLGTEYTQGIGFGYKTMIPCFTIGDLFKRLKYLIGVNKKKPTIKPRTDCDIIDETKQLETLLTTGSAKINVRGKFTLDHRTHTVMLISWPPGRKFESVLKKFSKELDSNIIGFSDLSTTSTQILFKILRERNKAAFFKEFVEKLKDAVTGTISFESVMVDEDNNVSVKPIDYLLLETFNRYKEISARKLKHQIDQQEKLKKELDLLEKIRPHLAKHISNLASDVDDVVNSISEKTKIEPQWILGLIEKYRIKKLMTLDTDTKMLVESIWSLRQYLKSIDGHILNEYEGILSNV